MQLDQLTPHVARPARIYPFIRESAQESALSQPAAEIINFVGAAAAEQRVSGPAIDRSETWPPTDTAFATSGKRAFDVIGTCALLILGAPVIAAVALAVLVTSGRPVFFAQERIGRGGKRFRCWKFRTMRRDAEKILTEVLARDPVARAEWNKHQKLRDDPRCTPIGRFLRRWSLDELPQLFNVLRGEMSLVGPRPAMPEQLPLHGRATHWYLAVRPGITGLWQISGRNGTSYRRRVALDGYYARNQTLRLDLIILLKTVGVVLSGRGAY
ncbi:MAG: sugar transferase [Gammaproteobacteria bacterium]|nr:sugar transferase [Gammaproteobacteria bacterium]